MVYLTRELDTIFNRFFYSFPREDPKPPVSVQMIPAGEDGYLKGEYASAQVQFAVAGFEEDDLKIYFEGRTLVIEGDNLKHDHVSDKFKCAFTRKISIRENLDLENTSISLKNGILNIILPIHDPEKNRKYILGGKK